MRKKLIVLFELVLEKNVGGKSCPKHLLLKTDMTITFILGVILIMIP